MLENHQVQKLTTILPSHKSITLAMTLNFKKSKCKCDSRAGCKCSYVAAGC